MPNIWQSHLLHKYKHGKKITPKLGYNSSIFQHLCQNSSRPIFKAWNSNSQIPVFSRFSRMFTNPGLTYACCDRVATALRVRGQHDRHSCPACPEESSWSDRHRTEKKGRKGPGRGMETRENPPENTTNRNKTNAEVTGTWIKSQSYRKTCQQLYHRCVLLLEILCVIL